MIRSFVRNIQDDMKEACHVEAGSVGVLDSSASRMNINSVLMWCICTLISSNYTLNGTKGFYSSFNFASMAATTFPLALSTELLGSAT